ncbi:amidase [Thiomicrorhabdus heinhorstiae]|uniref:Amidase n=1 Tax=Thiomicrorhabdus heinhorstiae TaxID=2748010 RepID=A0ABS0BXL8_9GAMM|nr:amidase [Thiomicrorhabdus heinhorstiae]MBF6058510.1 amidase [Thiomicrorhabdus heinhorstiae]
MSNSAEHGWIIKIDGENNAAGPLSGLRLAVKDLFDIAGYPTGAGNPCWLQTHAPATQTASVVQKLIDAGAQLAGKTITDELAYSLNGVNVHYGTPLNHADPTRLPGGSSSGSAAAVAWQEADIGLGTDTGGSVRVPASYNGLFGLRPTHGVIEMDHCVPLAPRFDTAGWLCRDLQTLQTTAQVLFKNTEVEQAPAIDKLLIFKPTVGGKVLLNETARDWIAQRTELFTEVVEVELEEAFLTLLSSTYRSLQGAQAAQVHGDWLDSVENPQFSADIGERFEWCRTIDQAEISAAEGQLQQVLQQLGEWFKDETWVAIMPTTPGAAPRLDEDAEALGAYRNRLMGITALAGLSRRPQLHLPVLQDQGAPWGLSLVGGRFADLQLIELAKRMV